MVKVVLPLLSPPLLEPDVSFESLEQPASRPVVSAATAAKATNRVLVRIAPPFA